MLHISHHNKYNPEKKMQEVKKCGAGTGSNETKLLNVDSG